MISLSEWQQLMKNLGNYQIIIISTLTLQKLPLQNVSLQTWTFKTNVWITTSVITALTKHTGT